jgi:hypothetical protein
MNPSKVLVLGLLLALSAPLAYSYDVKDRFKIIDDKLKTEAMLRPIGHDFFFDVSAALNKNLTDVIDDVSKATKTGTVLAASEVLTKYDKTEQTVKINVAIGSPLPSFTAWDVKLKPNFRILLDVGANIGIRSQLLTIADVVNFFPEGIPADLQTFVLTLTPGTDVITACAASTLSETTKTFCATQPTGKYIIPSITQTVPILAVFGKGDGKVGLFNDYTYGEHLFGNFNLYGLGRADLFQIVTADQIAKGQSIEAPKKLNTETSVQVDYRIGYNNSNYTVFLGLEELKLTKLKDADADSKPQTYGYSPLIRGHADATFKLGPLSMQPFVGFHKRSGYGFGDGTYVGSAFGAHVWGDRLGLQLRAMADKQYFTISPRIKLWLMQLEYSIKKPLKSEDGDVKLSALHSLDFRIFF